MLGGTRAGGREIESTMFGMDTGERERERENTFRGLGLEMGERMIRYIVLEWEFGGAMKEMEILGRERRRTALRLSIV